jgi:hypothetical protein
MRDIRGKRHVVPLILGLPNPPFLIDAKEVGS